MTSQTNPAIVLAALDRAQVNSALDADCRVMMRNEAASVRSAIQRKSGVAQATAEAVRVAKMWGVAV
jgi:hypothetical protein